MKQSLQKKQHRGIKHPGGLREWRQVWKAAAIPVASRPGTDLASVNACPPTPAGITALTPPPSSLGTLATRFNLRTQVIGYQRVSCQSWVGSEGPRANLI